MSEPDHLLATYLHLARASQSRQRWLVRDKLLVLAAATAAESGLDLIAACCRQRILQHNPGHLLGHFAFVSAALADEDFQALLAQLLRNYPREKAEAMLASLGIDLANESDAYFSQHEYAAALLGTTPDELESQFGHLLSDARHASPVSPASTESSPAGGSSQPGAGDAATLRTGGPGSRGYLLAAALGLLLAVGLLAAVVAWLTTSARNGP